MGNRESGIENQPSGWSVYGHDWAVRLLQRAITAGRPSHAYLFTGPAHIGRCTLALGLARALNCTGEQPPCEWDKGLGGACRACRLMATGAHPDVRVLKPDGASIKIDQVRELQHELSLSPVEGRFRVAIVDGMEMATAEAANALLKTLEEPPSQVVLVLVASEPEWLAPTIVSRCQHLALRALRIDQVRHALISHWGVDEKRAEELAHLASGRLGWAVMTAQDESVLHQRAARLDDLLRLLNEGRVARFAYAEQLAGDEATALETLELWGTWWRDVMLLAVGSHGPLVNIDRLPVLKQHAQCFGADRARLTLAALVRTIWHILRHANTRLTLETLMLDLPYTRPSSPSGLWGTA